MGSKKVTMKILRGLEANRANITPEAGIVLFTTDAKKLYVGDGSTVGGVPVSSSNVMAANKQERLAANVMTGDTVFQGDTGGLWILTGEDPALEASWYQINGAASIGLGNVMNYGISHLITEDNPELYASAKAVYTAAQEIIASEARMVAYANQVKEDILGGENINTALDTIAEISAALSNNDSAVGGLLEQIATKASKDEVAVERARIDALLNGGLADILVDTALTGTPTAPTVADINDATDKIATTKFVHDVLAGLNYVKEFDTIDAGTF